MKMLTHALKYHACAIAILLSGLVSSAHAEIEFFGFLNIEGGFVDDSTSFGYKNYEDEEINFNQNVVGLQATGEISEKLSATIQLLARGESNYEMTPEWAYVTWQATNNTKIRVGAIGTPFYMFSDFADVGYTYAWIRPPEEVYNLPISKFDGVNVFHNATLGRLDATIEAYVGGYGEDSFDISGFDISSESRKQFGFATSLGRDWWTVRAAYHQAELSTGIEVLPISDTDTFGSFAETLSGFGFEENADLLLAQDDEATFTGFGYKIDTGTFVSVAEYIVFDYKDNVFSKDVRYYAMGGVRFGEFLVHVTGIRSRDEASNPSQGLPDVAAAFIAALDGLAASQVEERDVYSLGLRWDPVAGTALKFQLDFAEDVGENSELDQTVFSIALQTVF